MRAGLCACAVALWGFAAFEAPTAADTLEGTHASKRWVVVPAGVGDDFESLHELAEAVRQGLATRGEPVWRDDRAAERFEVLGSAPAPELSQNDIDRWVERSRAAVKYLARADYKAARRELKAAQQVADRAAAELNREAARAQQVLDTCLFMVRAYVETRNGTEARRQARECRRLVPRVEPTAFRHTPEVRDLLAEVDREMASEAPGSLSVNSAPTDCLVRINGVEFGRTPLRDVELPVGTYRLQVECEPEQRGRIHRIAIESGTNLVMIEAALDLVVRTRPILRLEYPSLDAWSKDRMRDAGEVAAALGAANLLVVSEPEPGIARIDMDANGKEAASVWLPMPAGELSGDDLRRGVDAILEGRSVDFTGPYPTAEASWRVSQATLASPAGLEVASEDAAVVIDQRRPRGERIAGWSLLTIGAASMGVSVGLQVHRGTLGERFVASPSDLRKAQDWQDARVGVWTMAGVAGGTATAAMPLLLPDRDGTPWWAWALGGSGVGLAAYGIYQAATITDCPTPFVTDATAAQACVDRGQDAGRVALSIAGSAPLLTVPLVYLFRPLRVKPSMSVDQRGVTMQLGGTF